MPIYKRRKLRLTEGQPSSTPQLAWVLRPHKGSAPDAAARACKQSRTCAPLLQAQTGEDLLELGVLAQVRQLDVHASTQPGAQVGWAGEHVAQVLVPHEGVAGLLEDLLNLR